RPVIVALLSVETIGDSLRAGVLAVLSKGSSRPDWTLERLSERSTDREAALTDVSRRIASTPTLKAKPDPTKKSVKTRARGLVTASVPTLAPAAATHLR